MDGDEDPGDEIIDDTGDGTEDGTDTPAGGAGAGATGGTGAGATPPTPTTPPAGRTFTQAELDQIVRNRLSEDRRRREAAAGRGGNTSPSPSGATRQFDPETMAALREFLRPEIEPLKAQAVKGEVDSALSAAAAKYPDFAANKDKILSLITTWDPNLVKTAPLGWLLDQGYLAHKYSAFDEKAFRAQVEREYIDRKAGKTTTQPTPQGTGGKGSPTTPRQKKKSDPRDWSDTDAAVRALVEESERAGT